MNIFCATLGFIALLGMASINLSAAFLASSTRAHVGQGAHDLSRTNIQSTEKIRSIIHWLDAEGNLPYEMKKGMFADAFTGVNVHLKDSFSMSIITEEALTKGMFTETAIYNKDVMIFESLIANSNLGYEHQTKRHLSMEELAEQIKKVKASADRGELNTRAAAVRDTEVDYSEE